MASQTFGFLIPTTNVWDVSEIYQVDVKSDEFKELLVRLYQNLNNMATSVNIRDAGYYDVNELLNGQSYFPNPLLNSATMSAPSFRSVYRKVINWGALPNTGTTSVPHGITCSANTSFTRIYGSSTDPVGLNYIPIPYASPTLANNIELKVDATNVTIITGSNRSAFTITYVILEYLQT